MRGTPLLACALALAACHDERSPTAPAPPPNRALALEHVTEHFLLRHSAESAGLVDGYAAALEASWPRVTGDLDPPALPRIEGLLHADVASFTAATGFVAGGSVETPTRFHLVAIPFAPAAAVHEFAHCVSLQLEPRFGNNPVWLWEAVALYEAGQLVPPSSLPYLVAGDFPTLAELDGRTGHYSIYDVGYTLAEMIVERWGLGSLRELIGAAGDVELVLGLSVPEFERAWQEFVEARYL